MRAFLSRGASDEEILAAVEAVGQGLAVFGSEIADPVPQSSTRRADRPGRDGTNRLTARQTEILAMMAEGLGNKLIAARLGTSAHTVKFHVAAILRKLGAGTRTEAVTRGRLRLAP